MRWNKSGYGIIRAGPPGGRVRVSITPVVQGFRLTKWHVGMRDPFNPPTKTYVKLDNAKAAAEKWVKQQTENLKNERLAKRAGKALQLYTGAVVPRDHNAVSGAATEGQSGTVLPRLS